MGDVKLDTQTYTIEQLETKYRNFFAPAFEVLIDNTNIVREGVGITRISVDTSIEGESDSFSFQVSNGFDLVKREFLWLDKYFQLGKHIEVKMGYTDKLETIFYGLITSVKVNFPGEGTPTVNVTGMDLSFLMMKGKQSQIWNEKKHSEVAKEIGQKYVSEVVVDDTPEKLNIIDKTDKTDFQFLCDLAEQNNYEFFVIGKKMYFRKPLTQTSPVLTLAWGKNLNSFSTDMNLGSQVGQVIVRGWDDETQKIVEGKSQDVKKLGGNSQTGKDIMKKVGKESTEYVYTNSKSQKEAQERANAIMSKKSMDLIKGSGECIGIPEIRAGRYIKLEGLGKVLSQIFFITSATHTIDSSGYSTSFDVGGNAV